jgi:hypothetical protein
VVDQDQEVHLRVAQEEYSNLKSLVDHPGWKLVLEYAKGQIESRSPGIFTKLENILLVTAQEFEKGEVAGIQLFSKIPGIVIADLEEKIVAFEKELGYATGERTRDDGSDDRGTDDGGGLYEPPI